MNKHLSKLMKYTLCLVVIFAFVMVSCTQPTTSGSKSRKTTKPTKLAATRAAALPFPQNLDYAGCIKPQQQVDQQIINQQVKTLYVKWIKDYVRESNGNTPDGGYYVWMDKDPTGGTGKTTSEAHGYGMMTFAMMAGVDLSDVTVDTTGILDAKVYFDGMYNMYDKHRSKINNHLMSWVISETESTDDDSDSATDGDMDIAYALVMAHDQWGSGGAINYIAEAQRIVTFGIKVSDMCPSNNRVMLGDWSDWTSSVKEYGTRPSDWMTDHMRVFYKITGDEFWNRAINEIYDVTEHLQTTYSPNTGLLPDFAVGNPPKPAYQGWWPDDPSGWLEGPHDGDHAYNACRFPWRIAVDYAHYGEPRAKRALDRISNWLIPAHTDVTGDPPTEQYIPGEIVCGYYLDGTKISWDNDPPQWHGMSYTAPFTLACMVNSANQEAVDKGWWEMVTTPEGYYEDSINLLCALLLSGNWWAPGIKDIPPAPTPPPAKIVNPFSHQDFVPPSQNPPGGLLPEQVPQFISLGYDDNMTAAGINWVVDTLGGTRMNPAGSGNTGTYDGTPITFSFYQATTYKNGGGDGWVNSIEKGHEQGNHTNSHGHGAGYPLSQWSSEIQACESGMASLGITEMFGFRTPYLEYNDALFTSLTDNGYWYDCSIEEGWQWGQDGTNFFWPYTLDNGSPGHDVQYIEWQSQTKNFPITSHPGLWEMPAYVVMIPGDDICPDYGIPTGLHGRLKAINKDFDEADPKITGLDYNLLYMHRITQAEFTGIMKYNLDLRLKGNRTPFLFGMHSNYHGGTPSAPPAGQAALNQGMIDFIEYALTKPEVRIVDAKKVLDWIRNPVPLGDVITPTPTIVPETPTPTATPTSTPELVNLALNKTTGRSSQYQDFGAANAVDGNEATLFATGLNKDNQYIFVDLGEVKDVKGVIVKWFDIYRATKYQVYTSTDMSIGWNLQKVVNKTTGKVDIVEFPALTGARYVGLYLMQRADIAFAMTELEVMGYEPVIDPTPTPTATPTVTPTPTATPTPPADCTDAWDPAASYNSGAKVSKNCNIYVAHFWSQGVDPENNHAADWDEWNLVGPDPCCP